MPAVGSRAPSLRAAAALTRKKIPVTQASIKRAIASANKRAASRAASKKSVKKRLVKFGPKNKRQFLCAVKNSGYSQYLVKSRNGSLRKRCLAEKCTRSKDSRFHFPRAVDGHCGKTIDNMNSQAKLDEYLQYRKNLAKISREKSLAARKA